MNGLLTDLYELIMAAGYWQAGKVGEKAVFELSVRRLPENRNFILAAGLHSAVEYLLNLVFQEEEIAYLRGLPQFSLVPPAFFDYLRDFRFTGDLFAVPEGTPVFAGEPLLIVRAPIIEAQIPETFLLAAISFETMIASKAARVAAAAGGRGVVEFGTRRAHGPESGVLAGRAAYLGGCIGTSNVLAGFRYGIPVMGTSAHSWVMSFCSEARAFRKLQEVLGPNTIQLVDTYDTLEGVRRAAEAGRPLWGIRIDSGDFLALSRAARRILDDAGLQEARIMLSGDLDEYRIRDLLAAGAPVDAFGVGTQLATSADAPNLGAIYKLVELDISGIKRFTAKFSESKRTLPGAKQIFRFPNRDVLARAGECSPGEPLLRPIILGGRLLEPLPGARDARATATRNLARLPGAMRGLEPAPPWPLELSRDLQALVEQTSRNVFTTVS
ncbi:MAG: nicotinate phosphoribosyltransferase [Acidobacteria bacterium]|nr:nicotinate phosphoribosyltransferase [Acidobacteriota bacterium]